MEHLGAVQYVAERLFEALQNLALEEMCSVWGFESELDNLRHTVDTIKAVLLDAESKKRQGEQLTHQANAWVDQLKDAVYDADDLLDKFVTLAEQKQLRDKDDHGNLLEKVRRFFSFENPVLVAFSMSREVKEVRNKLDAIAENHNRFGLNIGCQPIRRRREETCSYVYTPDIIGRKDDLESIVGRLLHGDFRRDVSCVAIVGMGGLGKTALAQLVYNDPRIVKEFELRVWTCVSDQDQKMLDVKGVLSKVLQSLTRTNHGDLAMELVQKQLRDQLEGKKYVIVLDDVWSEDRMRLLELAKYLMMGRKGSWIVATTRSEQTANVLGDELVHRLKGLSEGDSWDLFERTAFGQGHELGHALDMEEIGQEIVKRCAGVPLAIKVVGSLLYGHPKEKWVSFKSKGLGKLEYGENEGIGPILKLSYLSLEPPLKMCFGYCALFPKDHVIDKEMLINLWMSQDYIVPEEGRNAEDTGNEYFVILVRRCFFQDITKNEYGEIVSCKIHDLMHDLALEVSGKEIYATNSFTPNLDSKIRHMSYNSTGEDIQSSFTQSKIRTCLHIDQFEEQRIPVAELLGNWMCLRALSLSNLRTKSLPDAIGKLLHLRYLDLSENHQLEMLPSSITQLHNLQTINLQMCNRLKELPSDLFKLVKLRVLDIDPLCNMLNVMPQGMGRLSCLQKLPLFVVGDNNSTSKQTIVDQMEDLKALTGLKGSLKIRIIKSSEYAVENAGERGYIRTMEHLRKVTFDLERDVTGGLLLEDLKPHPNLKELVINNYRIRRMPSWAIDDNIEISLPNLVHLSIYARTQLLHLPSLQKLCHLKTLSLYNLKELDYIQNETSESETFFPSLEELTLSDMPSLKGWWKRDETTYSNSEHRCQLSPSFPRLSKLKIENCPNLTCLPPCPTVQKLKLRGELNERLGVQITTEPGNSKLRCLETNSVGSLRSILSTGTFQALVKMTLTGDHNQVEFFSEVGDFLHSCSSSLRELDINSCPNLKSISGGLEHLTALESLELSFLPNLTLGDGDDEDEDGMPWRCLGNSLRSLELIGLPKVEKLPDGMRYLTALQSLKIDRCEELKSMPEWMPQLPSLKSVEISGSSDSLDIRGLGRFVLRSTRPRYCRLTFRPLANRLQLTSIWTAAINDKTGNPPISCDPCLIDQSASNVLHMLPLDPVDGV